MVELIGINPENTLWTASPLVDEAKRLFRHIALKFDNSQDPWKTVESKIKSHFGKSSSGTGLAMVESLLEVSGGSVSTRDLSLLIDATKEIAQAPVRVAKDVVNGLRKLSSEFPLILFACGDISEAEHKAESSGLIDFFHEVEVVTSFDQHSLRRVLYRYGVPAKSFVMVGSSLSEDIEPALVIGGHGFHITNEPAPQDHYTPVANIAEIFPIISAGRTIFN